MSSFIVFLVSPSLLDIKIKSIWSKNIIEFVSFPARSNKFFISFSLSQIYLLMISAADAEKKGIFASVNKAFTKWDLPVPEGP